MTYVVHTSLRASHRPQLSSSVRAISLPFVFNLRYNSEISKPYFYYVAVKTNPNNFGDQLYSTADSVENTAAAIDNDSSQQQQQKLIASALLTDSQQQQLDVVKSVLTSEGSSFGMPRSGHALYFLLLGCNLFCLYGKSMDKLLS